MTPFVTLGRRCGSRVCTHIVGRNLRLVEDNGRGVMPPRFLAAALCQGHSPEPGRCEMTGMGGLRSSPVDELIACKFGRARFDRSDSSRCGRGRWRDPAHFRGACGRRRYCGLRRILDHPRTATPPDDGGNCQTDGDQAHEARSQKTNQASLVAGVSIELLIRNLVGHRDRRGRQVVELSALRRSGGIGLQCRCGWRRRCRGGRHDATVCRSRAGRIRCRTGSGCACNRGGSCFGSGTRLRGRVCFGGYRIGLRHGLDLRCRYKSRACRRGWSGCRRDNRVHRALHEGRSVVDRRGGRAGGILRECRG